MSRQLRKLESALPIVSAYVSLLMQRVDVEDHLILLRAAAIVRRNVREAEERESAQLGKTSK